MIRPVKTGVLLEPIPAETRNEIGLIIPDIHQEPEPEGTVLAIGPEVQDVQPGDYVRYERYHELWVTRPSLAVVKEQHIIAVVAPGMRIEDGGPR